MVLVLTISMLFLGRMLNQSGVKAYNSCVVNSVAEDETTGWNVTTTCGVFYAEPDFKTAESLTPGEVVSFRTAGFTGEPKKPILIEITR